MEKINAFKFIDKMYRQRLHELCEWNHADLNYYHKYARILENTVKEYEDELQELLDKIYSRLYRIDSEEDED